MATTRHEPINKEVVFRFEDGSKGKGSVCKIEIVIEGLDTSIKYTISHAMRGAETTILCDENFNEVTD